MTENQLADVIIRAASVDDLPRLEELIAPFVAEKKLLQRTETELLKLLENGFVAELGERMIGFSAVEIYSRKLAELQCMAVAVDWHGKGVGRQLVQRCVALARERKIYELMAITNSDEFLQSCGFDYSLPNQKRALFIHTGELPSPD